MAWIWTTGKPPDPTALPHHCRDDHLYLGGEPVCIPRPNPKLLVTVAGLILMLNHLLLLASPAVKAGGARKPLGSSLHLCDWQWLVGLGGGAKGLQS